jgi:3-oxoacyl-[acyl-carrier protein] reductase
MEMDLGIAGRRAVVCGGSKGLGRAAAVALAREGAELTLFARSKDALTAAQQEISRDFNAKVSIVTGDVTDVAAREALVAVCPDADILVTNPGIRQTPDDFRTMSRETWDYWMEAHFFSSFDLIRAYAPSMKEQKFGRIVNISVSFVKFPQVGFAHSHSARLALSGAIASIVRELIPHNVTINSVCPGLIDTEALQTNLHGHAARGNTTYEAIVEDRLKGCPAGRFADPHEVGDLIAYLCADQSGFMTGQNIINDGGVYQGLF